MSKQRKLLLIVIVIALAVVVNQHHAVNAKAICDKAHNEISGASEQACGDALDKTNSTYICNQTNCWIERN